MSLNSVKVIFWAGMISAASMLSFAKDLPVAKAETKTVLINNSLSHIDMVESSFMASPETNSYAANTEFLNLESLIGSHKVVLNSEKIRSKVAGNIESIIVNLYRASSEVKSDGDRIFGRYAINADSLYSAANSRKNIDIFFRYLPRNFYIEVSAIINGSPVKIDGTDVLKHKVIKTLIGDRDKEIEVNGKRKQNQTVYLIEGDNFNPFGYIVAYSLVSMGHRHNDRHPGEYTALGIYHVERKKKLSINHRFDWHMPFALWYTSPVMGEGPNGIHEYHDTPFGREASHGCVREPHEFAQANFGWCPLNAPVIIIGNKNKSDDDSSRFSTADYTAFRALIDELYQYKQSIAAGNFSLSTISENQAKLLQTYSPILMEMLSQGQKSNPKFGKSNEFRAFVQNFVKEYDVLVANQQ